MNKQRLDELVAAYMQNIGKLFGTGKGDYDEGYKWRQIAAFKGHWNLDVPDSELCKMIVTAFSKSNLIESSMVHPLVGLKDVIGTDTINHENAEAVRNNFRALFVPDDGDVYKKQQRLDIFMGNMNALMDKYHTRAPGLFEYTNRSAICILNFFDPKNNYLFKATEVRNLQKFLEYGDVIGSGVHFSLPSYYRFCDALKEELKNYPEIFAFINKLKAKTKIELDDNDNILVYDIIRASGYDFMVPGNVKYVNGGKIGSIDNVQTQEKIVELENQISDVQEKIADLQLKPYPNLTGFKYTNTKLGVCDIIDYEHDDIFNQTYFSVKTNAEEVKRLSLDFILSNNIGSFNSDELREVLEYNAEVIEKQREYSKTIKNLQDEIKKLQQELDKSKKKKA